VDALNWEFINYLNFGGYPEGVFSEQVQEDPSRFIKSDVIDKVLLRDLLSLYGISDIQELNSPVCRPAYNTAQEVEIGKLLQNSSVVANMAESPSTPNGYTPPPLSSVSISPAGRRDWRRMWWASI